MKSIKTFFMNRKRELIVFLLLLLVAILSGINFGIIFGLTLFFWAASWAAEIPKGGLFLANVTRVIIFIVFIVSFVFAMMPRTKMQMAVVWDKFDQGSYKTGNATEVKAKDIWEMQRDKNGKEFLEYYNELLADGETEEAYDTLQKFQKAWNMEQLQSKTENDDQAQRQSYNPSPSPSPNITAPAPATGTEIKPKALSYGDNFFQLRAGQETPWLSFPNCRVTNYSVSSPDFDYDIAFSDEPDVWHPGGNSTLSEKKHVLMKIKARGDQMVTVNLKNS